MGASRVVLARELTIEEIAQLRAKTPPELELEAFVHGAMCMAYSGRCLISSFITGRSGNRGECTQPCRWEYYLVEQKRPNEFFKVEQQEGCSAVLSSHDLKAIAFLDELEQAGIESFKIEGRMKRPDYVFTVVSNYRKVIDQILENKQPEVNETMLKKLRVSFNREFTKGYLFGEANHLLTNTSKVNHQGITIGKVFKQTRNSVVVSLTDSLSLQDGIRIVDDQNSFGFTVTKMLVKGEPVKEAKQGDLVTLNVNPVTSIGATVLKTLDRQIGDRVESTNRFISISGFLRIKPDEYLSLTVSDGLHKVETLGPKVIEKAKKKQSIERFLTQIKKTGDTPFNFSEIKFDIDDDYYISVQALNQLRRDALDKLAHLRGKQTNRKYLSYSTFKKENQNPNQNKGLEVLVSTEEQLHIARKLGIKTIYYDIPNYFDDDFSQNIPVLQRIGDDNENQYPIALIHNLSQLSKTVQPIVSPYLNIVNSDSLAFVKKYGELKLICRLKTLWKKSN